MGVYTVNLTTQEISEIERLFEARKTVMHIINSFSASNKLKGVHIDEIVTYGESLGLQPEEVINVIQQLMKEGLIVEISKNRVLNKYPPINTNKRYSVETRKKTDDNHTLPRQQRLIDQESQFDQMAGLLVQSNIAITPQQLAHIQEEYVDIIRSGDPDLFFKGYPSDAEIGKRVGIDKRKVQGARALLGLLNERDIKLNFDRDKFFEWLSTPKHQRKGSREFAEELDVSYSTFKRKKALCEAYLKNREIVTKVDRN